MSSGDAYLRVQGPRDRPVDIPATIEIAMNHFPNLPPYQPPSRGWLSKVPSSMVPYLQLMRLDRAGGLTYFFLPHLFGTVHASIILGIPIRELLLTSSILLMGTIWMRGATCTWNDIVDAPFDRKVARTRHRAIARRAVSVSEALTFAIIQALLAMACLIPLPWETSICVIPASIGWFLYPLMKRVMDFPQVFLGLPMAWGVLVGETAMESTSLSQVFSNLFMHSSRTLDQMSILYLFGANFAWTLCYETMYSYQDVEDDEQVGVRSLALLMRHEGFAKTVLVGIACVMVGFLAAAGWTIGLKQGSSYFMGSVLSVTVALGIKLWNVDLKQPQSCWWWFARGGLITGSCILSGLVAEYLKRV